MYNRSVNQVHPDKQEYLDILWDLFKDVHGVRPRGMYDNTWPLEDLMQQVSFLQGCLEEDAQRDAREEARAVASVMAVGCPDEQTAQRWLDDAWEIY